MPGMNCRLYVKEGQSSDPSQIPFKSQNPDPAPKQMDSGRKRQQKWPGWKRLDRSLWRKESKTSLEPDELFRRTSGAVWMVISGGDVRGKTNDNGRLGSAVAISRRLLLTNCHVLGTVDSIKLVRGGLTTKARLFSADQKTDRCILTVDTEVDEVVIGLRGFEDLKVGEKVYSIGSPRGFERTLGDGLISGLRTTGRLQLVQTTAPVSPGSSGGGLFDRAGNLIGITTLLVKESQNLNFAVAASDFWKD
jgi:S1-C subfamily serine protease